MGKSAKLEKLERMDAWYFRAWIYTCKFSSYTGIRVSDFPLGSSCFPSWGDFLFPLPSEFLIRVFSCSLCFCKTSLSSHQWEMHQVVQGVCFLSLVCFLTIFENIVLAKNLRAHMHFFLPVSLPPSFPLGLFSSLSSPLFLSSFLSFFFSLSFFLSPSLQFLLFPSFPTVSIELFGLCKRATEERFAVPFVPHCPHKKQIFSGWLKV